MAVNKKNPYPEKTTTKPMVEKKPWGLMLLTEKTIEQLKGLNSVPSIVLANALACAQSSELDLSVLSNTTGRALSDQSAQLIRSLMEAQRRPGVDFKQVLSDALEQVWVKKVAPKVKNEKPLKKAPMNRSEKTEKSAIKKPTVSVPTPTVVVKKSRLAGKP